MRLVVVGGSRFGRATIHRLLEAGHQVVLVDRSREQLELLSDVLDCGLIEGDGTLPTVLRDAFGDGADALMLLTNHDDVNILGALVGRSVGFPRVILQIVRAELLDVTDELGLSEVITPHETVAQSIVSALEDESDVVSQLRLHKDLRIVTYTVPRRMNETAIGELGLPPQSRAIARIRGEDEELVERQTVLHEGDNLMIAASRPAIAKLEDMFSAD